jgi:hypothetical protein
LFHYGFLYLIEDEPMMLLEPIHFKYINLELFEVASFYTTMEGTLFNRLQAHIHPYFIPTSSIFLDLCRRSC